MPNRSLDSTDPGRGPRGRSPIPSSVRMPDYWHVDLAHPWQVRFWTREFGVTEGELRDAVEQVGVGVGDLRAHFARG